MEKAINLLKKYWWFIALLTVAGLFTILKPKYSSFSSSETRFAVTDTSSVTRVEIFGGKNSITLSKTDKGWLVNEKGKARREPVFLLLTVLSRINATAPIPISVSDSIMNEMEANGNVVTVFSGRKKMVQFTIYFTEVLNIRTVGRARGASTAYKLSAPMVGRDLIEFFSSDLFYWTDTRTKMANFSSLFAVEVEVPSNPEKSFRIDLQYPDKPSLIALYYSHLSVGYDTMNMIKYLKGIEAMSFDETPIYISNEKAGEIHFSEPDFIFTFYNKSSEPIKFSFIPIPIEEYVDEMGRTVQFDLNRMYLSCSINSKLYEIKFIDFATVLKDISYFKPKFQKGQTEGQHF